MTHQSDSSQGTSTDRFDAAPLIARMDRFPAVLRALVEPMTDAELFFVPPSKAWSIAQILGHLADEETEDFRTRTRMTLESLESPNADWPPIDPERTARERNYQHPPRSPELDNEPHQSLARFIRERSASIAWLRSLDTPDWTLAHTHPTFGAFTAGSLLGSWCAHDMLHLRQIAKRLYEITNTNAQPYATRYAGQWGA